MPKAQSLYRAGNRSLKPLKKLEATKSSTTASAEEIEKLENNVGNASRDACQY